MHPKRKIENLKAIQWIVEKWIHKVVEMRPKRKTENPKALQWIIEKLVQKVVEMRPKRKTAKVSGSDPVLVYTPLRYTVRDSG